RTPLALRRRTPLSIEGLEERCLLDGNGLLAEDDFFIIPHGQALSAAALPNDQVPAGAAVTAVLVSGPAYGQLSFQSDGAFTYTADNAFAGDDPFTYKLTTGPDESNTATVTITVGNTAPEGVADAYGVSHDQTLHPTLGVLGNDADAEGDAVT